MARALCFAGTVALLLVGCASSDEIERSAELHDQRARLATANQAYGLAAFEKGEAEQLHAEAARERAREDEPSEEAGDYAPIPSFE